MAEEDVTRVAFEALEKALESFYTKTSKILVELKLAAEIGETPMAEWNSDEKGYDCLTGRKKACKDFTYSIKEMVDHLVEDHDIAPDEIVIAITRKRDQTKFDDYVEELLEEEEEDEEDDEWTEEDLKELSLKELKTLAKDEFDLKVPKKAKKSDIIELILEEDDDEDDDEEDEDEEEFSPYKVNQKEVKSFAKEHELHKDEMKLLVEYANSEELSLEKAAREFGLLED